MADIDTLAQCEPNDDLPTVDINGIMELLPHRPPMLLIDRLYNMVSMQSAVGLKNVTMNEPFFEGHFPGHPVMPGVLQIEAMAQTAGALVVHSLGDEAKGKLSYFLTIDSARFRQLVIPGDTLRFAVNKIKGRGQIWKFSADAYVGEKRVSNAIISAMIVDK